MVDVLLEVFPRNSDGLNDSSTLAKFLAEVVRQGYLVLPQEGAFQLVDQLGAMGAWKPGVRNEVQTALAAYSSGASDVFDCYLRFCPPPDEDYGLLFRMTLYRDDGGLIFIGVNDGTFKYNALGLRNYERFIEFISLVYQTWPPLYGCMSDGSSWTVDEVRDLAADALYELTIFGPEYVAKIGREKFTTIHPWRKMRMDDGGYIIAVGVYARSCDPTLLTHLYPKAVAQELGLDDSEFMD